MTTQTDGRPETRMRWHSRCVFLASLCLLPLLGSLAYAQSAWPVAIYRLILDGGIALLWIAGATGLGMFVCRAMRLWDEEAPSSLRLATSAATGLGLLSLAILGLGLAGWLNFATAWGLIASGWIAGFAAARLGASVFVRSASSRRNFLGARASSPAFGCEKAGGPPPPAPRTFSDSSRTISSGTGESVRDADPTGIKEGCELKQSLIESAGWEWLALLATPFLALALTAALIPPGMLWTREEPHGYDVVEYHLQVPREWFEAHRIVPLHHNVFAYLPFNVEMHYLLAMHLRGGPWAGMYLAQFMHLTFMVLAVVAVYGIACRCAGTAGAMIAAMSLLTVPWLTQLAGIAYDEGGFLLFGVLSIGWAMRGFFKIPTPVLRYAEEPDSSTVDPALRSTSEPASSFSVRTAKPLPNSLFESRHRLGDFAFAGAMAGFCAGCKLTAVPEILLAVPLVCVCLALWRTIARSERGMAPWAGIALFCLVGAITFSPWLIRNARWTGNPVFPELMPILGHGDFTPVQVKRWELAYVPPAEQRPLIGRAKRFCDEIVFGWQFGYLLLPMGLIGFLLSMRNPLAWWLLGLLLILTIVWLFFSHLQGRFYVLAAPVAALLVAQIDWRQRHVVGAVLVIFFALIGWVHINAKLYSSIAGEIGIVNVLGIDDMSLITLKQPPLDKMPGGATLCLVGDAKAFWYPLPMSRLRYRTVFDVKSDEPNIVDAWIGHDGKQPGEVFLIDPEELKRFSRTYFGLPPVPDEVKVRRERYVMP